MILFSYPQGLRVYLESLKTPDEPGQAVPPSGKKTSKYVWVPH